MKQNHFPTCAAWGVNGARYCQEIATHAIIDQPEYGNPVPELAIHIYCAEHAHSRAASLFPDCIVVNIWEAYGYEWLRQEFNNALPQFRQECQSDDILERSIWAHVDNCRLGLYHLAGINEDYDGMNQLNGFHSESGQSLVIVVLVLCAIALIVLAASADSGAAANVSLNLCHLAGRCQW